MCCLSIIKKINVYVRTYIITIISLGCFHAVKSVICTGDCTIKMSQIDCYSVQTYVQYNNTSIHMYVRTYMQTLLVT